MLDRISRRHGLDRRVLGGVAALLVLHAGLLLLGGVLYARGDPSLLIATAVSTFLMGPYLRVAPKLLDVARVSDGRGARIAMARARRAARGPALGV